MKKIYYILVSLFCVFSGGHAWAQGGTVHSDPRLSVLLGRNRHPDNVADQGGDDRRRAVKDKPVKTKTTAKQFDFDEGYIERSPRSSYSGKGFRVQIYNGADREKAVSIKREFSQRYPNIHSYLTYISPCFRVKVGDYRNRSDAEGMFREAHSSYTPCMIVPDIVSIHSN